MEASESKVAIAETEDLTIQSGTGSKGSPVSEIDAVNEEQLDPGRARASTPDIVVRRSGLCDLLIMFQRR